MKNKPSANTDGVQAGGRPEILVRKLDENGAETWRYTGRVIARGPDFVRLEARFDREDRLFHGLSLLHHDRFIETFFSQRWYNIFAIHDRQDDRLKGWYCNVGCPAEIVDDSVSYRDLALDLLVFPDGHQLVLDEDEFQELDLDEETRQAALAALVELQAQFAAKFAAQSATQLAKQFTK